MSRDGWIGVGLLLFCGWLYLSLGQIPANPLVPIGPDFYPRVLLLLLIGLSLALVLEGLFAKRLPRERAAPGSWLREYQAVWLSFSLFFLYVVLLPRLGFLFSTILFVAALQWILGERTWRRLPGSLLTGIGTAVATYLVFEKYLYVLLPRASWLP
ncbi:MAG TPA: tripartite tricarboxylate transporter TctB family protein [Candidatus Acidoferrales bacterium]|nr:tripartite tricarboxylate transporter TctB family protein [Candidatus Acidoferrales bacterium]